MGANAVVLGGGGAVGIGWQAGLLTGLAEADCDLSGADLILGTSAGALVGALLACGADLAGAVRSLTAMGAAMAAHQPTADQSAADQLTEGSRALLTAMAQAGDGPEAVRSIGRLAERQRAALDEETFLGLVADLDDRRWPARFRCTATDVVTGELVVWTSASGVELRRAVAASCAAPLVLPPVTVDGRRYTDGGVLSHVNVRAAVDADADAERMLVLSCFPLDQPLAAFQTVRQEIAEVRASGTALLTVEPGPEVLALGAGGAAMMNPALAEPAFVLGRAQAVVEKDRIAALFRQPGQD